MGDEPVTVMIAVDDPWLAERLTALLSGVPGLRLAAEGDHADAEMVATREPPDTALTPREAQVLDLLAQGASNKAIARALGISVDTAKFHVGRLIDKLDATGRTDAVAHAARTGVLHL